MSTSCKLLLMIVGLIAGLVFSINAQPAVTKQLYLSDPTRALDRIDPVASADATTAQTDILELNCNGNAVSVFSSSNTLNPTNAVATFNTTVAEITASTGSLVLNLGTPLSLGTVITIRMKYHVTAGGSIPFARISESTDGIAFGATTNISPLTTTLADYTYTVATANMSYLKIESRHVAGNPLDQFVDVDAVSYACLSGANVTVEATTSASASTGTSLTINHTTGSNANRLMLVGIGLKRTGVTVTSVTYGGTALTLVGTRVQSDVRIYIYQLINPPTGPADVVVSYSGVPVEGTGVGVTTFSGVDQVTPLGLFAGANGTSNAPSVNATSASNELVYAVAAVGGSTSIAPGAGQTELWDRTAADVAVEASTEPGAGVVTMNGTSTGSDDWATGGVSIKPAAAINSVAFTQSPVLCSSLTIKSGQTISVSAYATIVSGAMPASPNITAVLRYGVTNIISLSAPSYNSGTGLITWTGTLGSDVTVPAGQAIALEITTAQSGVAFRIDYDSQTKPSKIELPVSTYIDITSYAVYNAPYPAGSIITNIATGLTVYPRAVVSDPFGFNDITGMDITITPPGTMVSGTSVATAGCTRTYEYTWNTTGLDGTYSIPATAEEGLENTVTDVQALSFDVFIPTAPGGVYSNNTLWLKADAGTGTTIDGAAVNTWSDQSIYGYHATTTSNTGSNWINPGVNPPTYQAGSNTNAANFNPTVNFAGSRSLDGTGGLATHQVFTVHKNVAGTTAVLGFDDPAGNGAGGQGTLWQDPTYIILGVRNTSNGNNIQVRRIFTFGNPSAIAIIDAQHISNADGSFWINGDGLSATVTPSGTAPSPFSTPAKYRLGKASNNTFPSSPVMAEVISYSRNLTTTERQRVTSYLGVKYGITIGHNYLDADENVIWDRTTNAGFNNNIAGIARDDESGLYHKQSKSVNSGLQLVIGNGNTIANSNAANGSTFTSDKSAMIWGNNSGSAAFWTTTGAPEIRKKIVRNWRIQESGTVGSVKIQIADNSGANGLPAEETTVYLLLDADGNFTSGATEIAMTLNGTNWEANVDLTNGQYFSFATEGCEAKAPVLTKK
jgi:hypothetical protein